MKNEDIKQLLENIRPDENLAHRDGTPDAMVKHLYEHQKLGLAWMEEGSNKGGILGRHGAR